MNLIQALRLSEAAGKPIVALVGAGGKSSLLFRLGDELGCGRPGHPADRHHPPWGWAGQPAAPITLLSASEPTLAFELPTSLRGYGQALALAGPAREPGKLAGLTPDVIGRLAGLEEVAAAVIEADGSRQRPLKAPASHEPLVPACATHVVVVAGMAAVGRPLDAAAVHRPERFAALTGLAMGAPLTPQAIAAALVHPNGGRQGCPAGAVPLLYLNLMLDDAASPAEAEQRMAAARSIAAVALAGPSPAFHRGADRSRPGGYAGGRSAWPGGGGGAGGRRLQPTGRRRGPSSCCPGSRAAHWPAARWISRAAGAVDEVVVVVGHRAGEVQAALGERPVRVVVNAHWQAGQSSSVATGLASLGPEVSAALFVLADQPEVAPDVLNRLVERHRQTLAPVVTPVYQGGQRGNPVLFDRRTFPELLALEGDTGGRPLIQRYGSQVAQVEIAAPLPQGIETMEDYRRGGNEE
ncbi:MAG: selenium cofactor biosynthesis protein YqeC [Microthrixaceae bacterium]